MNENEKEKFNTIFNSSKDSIEDLKIFLRAQIEYYFSDSNLLYDLYMQKLLSKNKKGYIELREFLRFNKVRKNLNKFSNHLGFKLKLLEHSLAKSEILKLNSNKKKVKRRIRWETSKETIENFKEKKRKRTIYVENFCTNFTEKDLFEIFQRIGDINTIDLSKDKNNTLGYCFIEFKNENMAITALGMNNYVPLKLMEKSNGKILPLKVMSYMFWRTFKDKITKIIKEQQTFKKKSFNVIYVCFVLDKNSFGISKKELIIILRQIKAKPISIDLYEYDKIVITLDSVLKYNKICQQLKMNHELLDFLKDCYILEEKELVRYKEHVDYIKYKIERKKSIKKIAMNKFY